MAAGVKTGGGEWQHSPISTTQAYEVSDEASDDFCPECFGDDLIDLANGNQICRECRAVIDY